MFVLRTSPPLLLRLGLGRVLGHVVMMEVQVALHKKHGQKAAQQPTHGQLGRMKLFPRVGRQMQHRHAKHQAGNETCRHLHPCVCQTHARRQPTSEQRGQNNQRAIGGQQHHGLLQIICTIVPEKNRASDAAELAGRDYFIKSICLARLMARFSRRW